MSKTATVEVLTAEVRALMVGSRQITLSVFRQLDWVKWEECEAMGRVNDDKDKNYLDIGFVVGKHRETGVLCRAKLTTPPRWEEYDQANLNYKEKWKETGTNSYKELAKKRDRYNQWWDENSLFYFNFKALPLIVLAGLK